MRLKYPVDVKMRCICRTICHAFTVHYTQSIQFSTQSLNYGSHGQILLLKLPAIELFVAFRRLTPQYLTRIGGLIHARACFT